MNHQTAGDPGGPEGLHESPRAHPIAGEFVTETLLEYDGGCQVTVYVPPHPPEAVVFAGDGQGFSKWGRFLEATDVPSTMIIGVHGLPEEMPRLHEYSPGLDGNGSRRMSTFSSTTSAGGRGRVSESSYPPNALRCSVTRQGESSHSRLGLAIRTPTVRSSLARRAGVTHRQARCRLCCRGCTSSPARSSRSSSTTRPGGLSRSAMQVRTS